MGGTTVIQDCARRDRGWTVLTVFISHQRIDEALPIRTRNLSIPTRYNNDDDPDDNEDDADYDNAVH